MVSGKARQPGVIYTALTRGYDSSPIKRCDEPDIVVEVRVAPKEIDHGREGALWNREQKLKLPPKAGLWSLYLDASLKPKAPIYEVVCSWLEKADIAFFKHPWRSCAYDEIDECVKRGKITPIEAERARAHLQLAGFPKHFGLWACGVIARRTHANPTQAVIGGAWFELVQQLPRDQIWLPFVLWRFKDAIKRVHTIDASIYNNEWLFFRRHSKHV